MHVQRFERTIQLVGESGLALPARLMCEFCYGQDGDRYRRECSIALSCSDFEVKGDGPDFFEAFCRIREDLATYGLMPLCYGASCDVFPSSMARDMGNGLKAYRMRLGQPAGPEDLVGIFDEGPDIVPASVAVQREFWREWLRSHGITPRA